MSPRRGSREVLQALCYFPALPQSGKRRETWSDGLRQWLLPIENSSPICLCGFGRCFCGQYSVEVPRRSCHHRTDNFGSPARALEIITERLGSRLDPSEPVRLLVARLLRPRLAEPALSSIQSASQEVTNNG